MDREKCESRPAPHAGRSATEVTRGSVSRPTDGGSPKLRSVNRSEAENAPHVLEFLLHLGTQPGDLLVVGGYAFSDRLDLRVLVFHENVDLSQLLLEPIEPTQLLLDPIEPAKLLLDPIEAAKLLVDLGETAREIRIHEKDDSA